MAEVILGETTDKKGGNIASDREKLEAKTKLSDKKDNSEFEDVKKSRSEKDDARKLTNNAAKEQVQVDQDTRANKFSISDSYSDKERKIAEIKVTDKGTTQDMSCSVVNPEKLRDEVGPIISNNNLAKELPGVSASSSEGIKNSMLEKRVPPMHLNEVTKQQENLINGSKLTNFEISSEKKHVFNENNTCDSSKLNVNNTVMKQQMKREAETKPAEKADCSRSIPIIENSSRKINEVNSLIEKQINNKNAEKEEVLNQQKCKQSINYDGGNKRTEEICTADEVDVLSKSPTFDMVDVNSRKSLMEHGLTGVESSKQNTNKERQVIKEKIQDNSFQQGNLGKSNENKEIKKQHHECDLNQSRKKASGFTENELDNVELKISKSEIMTDLLKVEKDDTKKNINGEYNKQEQSVEEHSLQTKDANTKKQNKRKLLIENENSNQSSEEDAILTKRYPRRKKEKVHLEKPEGVVTSKATISTKESKQYSEKFVVTNTDSPLSKKSNTDSDSEEEITNKDSKSDSDQESETDDESNSEPTFTKRASNDPNFAVVYSFLTIFGGLLNLPELSINEFEECLDNCNDLSLDSEKHGLLEKLHLKLLRRLSRSCKSYFSSLSQVSNDRLIKYLIKFSKYVDLDLAWDMEKFGYHVLGSSERLLLLKALCEIHFDENSRFKVHFTDEYIKTDNIAALRLQPIGYDLSGKAVWYQQDNVAGFRIYSVEEDDEDGKSWKLLASNTDDFEILITNLKRKSEVNPKDVALAKRKERTEKKKLAQEQATTKGRQKSKVNRKRKKNVSESDSDEEDENPCAHCYSNKRPDLVLLCDLCDAAYHTLCLRPPLMTIPEGDWHCPYCKQLSLIEMLTAKLNDVAARKKIIERAAKRAVFDDIKLSNIVEHGVGESDPNSRRSGRRRTQIDYNFSNYDQLITEAISTPAGNARSRGTEAILSHKFYSSSSRGRKHRRLNDLNDDSCESNLSDYQNDASGNDLAPAAAELEKAIEKGCRRSRRLKRKFNSGEESASSESEDDAFVRRSTRRVISTQNTYVDYESDDTPEEVVESKKKVDDEYVCSGSEEDAEEMMHATRGRRVILSDVEDDGVLDEEVETDLEEDEALCLDYEKNVVSDDSDEQLELSEEEEEIELLEVKSTTEEEDYDGDSDDVSVKEGKREEQIEEDEDDKGKGGKDISNIIKSMREEQCETRLKISAKDADRVNVDSEASKELDEKHGDQLKIDEKHIGSEISSGKEIFSSIKEDSSVEEETKQTDSIVGKCSDTVVEDRKIANIDVLGEKSNEKLECKAIKKETDLSLDELPSAESFSSSLSTKISRQLPSRSSMEIISQDIVGTVRTEGAISGASISCPVTGASTLSMKASDTARHQMVYPPGYGKSNEYGWAPPFPPRQGQLPPQMGDNLQRLNALRSQPYVSDMKRQVEPFARMTTPPYHNPYLGPPSYQNYFEPRQYYQAGGQRFSQKAPPGYPGFASPEGKPPWSPQGSGARSWDYRYRGMAPYKEGGPVLPYGHANERPPYEGTNQKSPFGEANQRPHYTMPNQQSPYAEVSQRPAGVPLHRPYMDVLNVSYGQGSGNPLGMQGARPQKRTKNSNDNAKRPPEISSNARAPSATESYAAFQNMVITPAKESSRKKGKR